MFYIQFFMRNPFLLKKKKRKKIAGGQKRIFLPKFG